MSKSIHGERTASGTIPASIPGPFTYSVVSPDSGYGAVSFDTQNYPGDTLSVYTVALSNLNTLTVTTVPEPSTWAMTLLGFAGLGLAAHSRTKKTAGLRAAA